MSQNDRFADYVDVAARITQFYEKFPDGRLEKHGWQVQTVGDKVFVVYEALAYRTADDPHPAPGTAWEPFPGPTSFTKDSELMNAETAALGRAIVNAGIPSKKVASKEEVKARAPVNALDPVVLDEQNDAAMAVLNLPEKKRAELRAWASTPDRKHGLSHKLAEMRDQQVAQEKAAAQKAAA